MSNRLYTIMSQVALLFILSAWVASAAPQAPPRPSNLPKATPYPGPNDPLQTRPMPPGFPTHPKMI
ncbi:hypothetical protein BT63DRAFT_476454 [Microthyrium microscopicum]|uniref:Uncharacterized protein n=1 Tax=Microthyrium microscopicum TaxID=703497 RepID=A0A6A6UJ57_9PEZI|nr:hypothetical protein BT63DRAFT_476454 [Microthyrium microscopicum]